MGSPDPYLSNNWKEFGVCNKWKEFLCIEHDDGLLSWHDAGHLTFLIWSGIPNEQTKMSGGCLSRKKVAVV